MVFYKGIIYYSNGIREPIKSMVKRTLKVGLPITESIKSGRCYYDMVCQIYDCLKKNKSKYVFFCEHDVLYNPTHFNFDPKENDVFYYNKNVWRWDYPKKRYITYEGLISLSGLCVNREFALEHYKKRLEAINKMGDEKYNRDPNWARKWGYEPGLHKRGFSKDKFELWKSEKPLIDIRHQNTFSPRKVTLREFKHRPTGWKVIYERP